MLAPRTIDLEYDLWPKQLQALNTDATELLFGGASEGGKSHFVRVALCTWCIGIENLQCVLIRKKYKDILANHVEGPTGFRKLLEPLIEERLVRITKDEIRFWNGSLITFVHCQDERQFDSAQGVEKHVLVIDEATQISERLIRFFRAWCRIPKEEQAKLPKEFRGKFPRIIYTANPIGASVGFFRRHFVFARPAYAIETIEGFRRQYIPSRYTDNLSVDEEAHKGRLAGIGDAAIAKALDVGDWSALAGDYFPEWDEDRHVVADFMPPPHWFKFRTLDLGYHEPTAVYWVAVSDGEPFQDGDGNERWFPAGALVFYREWYICNPEKPEEGLRLRNSDIARGILERTVEATSGITLTDSLPFQDRGLEKNSQKYTVADLFFDYGCPLTRGNTARIHGWAQLRDRLVGEELSNGWCVPLIFFCESCRYARDYIPALGRNPNNEEDAAEKGEATHAPDAVRLACTARPRTIKKPGLEQAKGTNSLTMKDALALAKRQREAREQLRN